MPTTAHDAADPAATGLSFGPRRLNLWLAAGVSRGNMATLLFGSFFGIVMMGFINASHPFLFTEVLLIPTAEQGPLAGHMTFVSEVLVILVIGLVGALSDRIGRKPLYVAAFLLLGAGYLLYPLARDVDELTLARLVHALGIACNTAMLPAVANDYPVERSRAKLLSICLTLNGLGLVLVLAPLRLLLDVYTGVTGGDAPLTARYWLWTAAGICLVVSTVLALGLKGGPPLHLEKRESLLVTVRTGLAAGRSVRIALAYAAAMVARGDMAVLGTFFVLWLTQQGVAGGLDTAAANGVALKFYILIQVFAMCWLPVMGWLLDRVDRVAGLAFAMVLGGVGYGSLYLFDDPLGSEMYVAAVLVGMGEMSANIASLTLIGSEAPPKVRGAVIGLFSLFGAIGILLVAKVGGIMSGTYGTLAPFLLVAGANAVVLVLALVVWARGRAVR
jgi:MFS family permease